MAELAPNLVCSLSIFISCLGILSTQQTCIEILQLFKNWSDPGVRLLEGESLQTNAGAECLEVLCSDET